MSTIVTVKIDNVILTRFQSKKETSIYFKCEIRFARNNQINCSFSKYHLTVPLLILRSLGFWYYSAQ